MSVLDASCCVSLAAVSCVCHNDVPRYFYTVAHTGRVHMIAIIIGVCRSIVLNGGHDGIFQFAEGDWYAGDSYVAVVGPTFSTTSPVVTQRF